MNIIKDTTISNKMYWPYVVYSCGREISRYSTLKAAEERCGIKKDKKK